MALGRNSHILLQPIWNAAALHGAVWSGGLFVYVPPGVSVTIPLQSYFRLNAPGAGQFEHSTRLAHAYRDA